MGANKAKIGRWNAFLRLAAILDRANAAICVTGLVAVFLAQPLVVLLRYLFAIGFVELQNFVTYAFAAFCVLSVPLALRSDKHVRVDVFRDRLSRASARLFDNVAILFLLIPVFGFALYHSMPLVIYSWSILEGSRDTGGLPGYFLVLTALPVMCLLLIIQGVAIVVDRTLIHSASDEKAL